MKHRISALLLAALLMSTVVSMPVSASGEDAGFAARLEQEKSYLLEALERLEELGLSPIAIWSEITNDESVLARIGSVSQSASEAVTEAAQNLGESLSEAASQTQDTVIEEITEDLSEAAQEQTEAVKQGIIEQIRSWINGLLDDL